MTNLSRPGLRKRDYLGIIGLAVGILGVVFAIYSHFESKKQRVPIFLQDPVRTVVFDTDSVAAAPIQVTKDDGSSIDSDLIMARFYFWNEGKLAVKPDHILQPIQIVPLESTVNLLDVRVVVVSRDVVNPAVDLQSHELIADCVNVKFDILEHQDGFVLDLLFEGQLESTFVLNGVVEGAGIIQDGSKLNYSIIAKQYMNLAGIFLLTTLIFLLAGLIIYPIYKYVSKYEDAKQEDKPMLVNLLSKFPYVIAPLLICSMFVLILYKPYEQAKVSSNDPASRVPVNLRSMQLDE